MLEIENFPVVQSAVKSSGGTRESREAADRDWFIMRTDRSCAEFQVLALVDLGVFCGICVAGIRSDIPTSNIAWQEGSRSGTLHNDKSSMSGSKSS